VVKRVVLGARSEVQCAGHLLHQYKACSHKRQVILSATVSARCTAPMSSRCVHLSSCICI
jgi:hypothetical protein